MNKSNAPGNVNGLFVAENAALLQPPTQLTPQDFNMWMMELCNLVTGAGLTLDSTNQSQVLQAVQTITNADNVGIRGNSKNLMLSGNSASPNITCSFDAIILQSNSGSFVALSALSLTAATGSASGVAGSLDVGAWVYSTWYYIYVIYNGTNVNLLFSASSSSPVLPPGYGAFARVGSFRTPSASNYNPPTFKQVRNRVSLSTPVVMASGTSVTLYTPVGVSNFSPPTATEINVTLDLQNLLANQGFSVAPNSSYTSANAPIGFWLGNVNYTFYINSYSLLLESSNIYWGGVSSGVSSLFCNGWVDSI